MSRRTVFKTTLVTLLLLGIWWGNTRVFAQIRTTRPAIEQSKLIAFYPDVYYPAIPGKVLAYAHPFAFDSRFITVLWLGAFALAISIGATRITTEQDASPTLTAATVVVVLFITTTILEALVTLFL